MLEGWILHHHRCIPAPGKRRVACAGKVIHLFDALWETDL